MRDHRSLLGLDEEDTFLQKLGLFLSALLLGPLLGLLLFAGIHPLEQPWRSIAEHCCQTLALFWLCLLVFIWWRPPWFRRLYLSVEPKAIHIVRVVGLACLHFVCIVLLIGWLKEMRIL